MPVTTAAVTKSAVTKQGITSSSGVIPSLAGSVATFTTDQAINLTSLAGIDWAAYGYNVNQASIERKATGGSKISVLAGGGGTFNNVSAPSWSVSWGPDGTPDATIASERFAVFNSAGIGLGLSFTAPADTTLRTLTVYAAVSSGTTGMKITATLSDASAGPYVDTSVVGGGGNVLAKYVIIYRAASMGRTLTIAIVNNTSNAQSVNIYGATLS